MFFASMSSQVLNSDPMRIRIQCWISYTFCGVWNPRIWLAKLIFWPNYEYVTVFSSGWIHKAVDNKLKQSKTLTISLRCIFFTEGFSMITWGVTAGANHTRPVQYIRYRCAVEHFFTGYEFLLTSKGIPEHRALTFIYDVNYGSSKTRPWCL